MKKSEEWFVFSAATGTMFCYILIYIWICQTMLEGISLILAVPIMILGMISALGIWFLIASALSFMMDWWGTR